MDEIPCRSLERTVLPGDACRPFMPFGFSGTSIAIEDAITFSVLLPSGTKVDDIADCLKLYEEIRKLGVCRVRDTGQKNAGGADCKDPTYIVKYMDLLFSMTPFSMQSKQCRTTCW